MEDEDNIMYGNDFSGYGVPYDLVEFYFEEERKRDRLNLQDLAGKSDFYRPEDMVKYRKGELFITERPNIYHRFIPEEGRGYIEPGNPVFTSQFQSISVVVIYLLGSQNVEIKYILFDKFLYLGIFVFDNTMEERVEVISRIS